MASGERDEPIDSGEEEELTDEELMLPPGGSGMGGRIRARDCFYKGKRYSPGSVVVMSDGGYYECRVSGTWRLIV